MVIRLSSTANKHISISLIHFDTKEGLDYIEIFDGLTTKSPSLLRVSGSNSISVSIRTTGYQCLVRFTSTADDEDGIVYSGFFIAYTEI